MSRMELYAGARASFTTTPIYKVVKKSTQSMSQVEYLKFLRNLQNYTETVSHESEQKYDKEHYSYRIEPISKPEITPKPYYCTQTQATNSFFYTTPHLIAAASQQGVVYNYIPSQSYNEYVYDLVQYHNLWITSHVTNDQGYYIAEQFQPVYDQSNLKLAYEDHGYCTPSQSTSNSKEISKTMSTQDDAIKKLVHHPIKKQIIKFKYLLSQINYISENGYDLKQETPKLPPKPTIEAQCTEKTHTHPKSTQSKAWKLKAGKSIAKQNTTKTFLGLYEVLKLIGVGGGGVVYAGTEISSQKLVAIKRIVRSKVKRWGSVGNRNVPQEIALMIKVNGHRNVIKLINWYECLDSYIMIMERPNNSIDLFDYIRDVGRITEDEGAYIFRQVVEAVKHVQERGVLHRDVKDENVIIDNRTKKAKLIDFGCATLLHSQVYTDFSGTPEFYPPEWYTKKEYEGRPLSVWSLGVLLYDILCGEIPFKTKSSIIENNPLYKVYLSKQSKNLMKWMLSTDERSRPSLSQIINHPWIQRRSN